jgi:TPR repeat protein
MCTVIDFYLYKLRASAILKLGAIGLMLAVLALPATAQDYAKGGAAHGRGDYATALREWRPLADRGDAEAQHSLGLMYLRGQGLPQDDAEAVKWFRKAAEQGHAGAQHNLGLSYTRGQGVPHDGVEAVKWCHKAAEQGIVEAQYSLGLRYAEGQGVRKNIVQAYMWWTLAALEGHQKADAFRDGAAKQMTPSEIAMAKKLARAWWAKHKKKRMPGAV